MDNKEFDKLVQLWKKEKKLQENGAGPAKTKDCLFFTEFEAYTKDGCEALSSIQKEHIQSCAYCRKMIAGFEKVVQEEKLAAPIKEWIDNLSRFIGEIRLPRLAPALAPALAIIFVFIILSNQALELKNYSVEYAKPAAVTRGIETVKENKFKIHLTVNNNGYVYLFGIDNNEAVLLIQEKVIKGSENILPKEKWLQGEGKLVLVMGKKPLEDPLKASELIIKYYDKKEREIQTFLRRELKRKDISIKIIDL